MPNRMKEKCIILCSDSTGETANAVVQATLRQFDEKDVKLKSFAYISSMEDIRSMIEEAEHYQAIIVYTLVQPEFRELLQAQCLFKGIQAVDVMGPMLHAFIELFDMNPIAKPGLLHRMDEDYFRRVEAMEFTVKYDDGKDSKGILLADIVIIGISRTSKTPLSVFLAHKGYKVANMPLVPEVKAPLELRHVPKQRLFGLTMDMEQIYKVRTERLKSLGLTEDANYASLPRILEELEYAQQLMKSLGCCIIDVTNKAVEETAGIMIQSFNPVHST